MMVRNPISLALLTPLIVGLGCSKGPTAPTTVPVSGTIKYNGQPVAQATVTFQQKIAEVERRQHPAHGTTDDQGHYTLTTFVNPKDFKGAVPGDYAVTISKMESAAVKEWDAREAYKQLEAKQPKEGTANAAQGMKAVQQASQPKSAIPTKYNDPKTSDLSATVKPSGEQTFDFDLTD